MTIYNERDNKTILSMAGDADGDPLTVIKINGQEALVGVPIPLAVGGSVTVTSQGVVTFDDTGFTVPAIGDFVADGLIATITDGTDEVDTNVNLQLYGATSAGVALFGALTRRFEGGHPAPSGASAITGGDPNGHFAISGGMILPTLAGEGNLSGTYVLTMDTGETQEVTILPGVISVRGDAELSGLLSDPAQPFDGHTIQLRPGNYDKHVLPVVTFENGGVTVTADSSDTKMRQLFMDRCFGNPEIIIRGIDFTSDTPETEATNRIVYIRNTTPNGICRIQECRFSGHVGINADPTIWYAKLDYTGASAVPVAGERIDNDGGGDAGAYTTIFEVHDNGDGTGTLFVDDNPGKSNGGSADNQGVKWASGQVMTGEGGWTATLASSLYGGDDTLGNGIEGGHAFDEMYVERCVFERLSQALEVAATRDVVVRDCVARDLRADFVKIHCPTGVPPTNQTLVERNLLSRGMVGSSDFGNPHRDGIQLSATSLTENWRNMVVRDNLFWTGLSDRAIAKTNGLQPLFLPAKNSNGFGLEGAEVLHNISDSGGAGNSLIASFAYSVTVENNTCVPSLLRNSVDHPGAVKVFVGTTVGDTLSVIRRNITETLSAGGNDVSDNITAAKYFDFSTYFPAWTGVQDFTDVSTLLASLTPGTATPVMAGSTWDRFTDHGCVNELGQFIGHDGTDLTDHFLELEEMRDGGLTSSAFTGDAPGMLAPTDWSVSDPTTGGALEITIEALPVAGGGPILDLQASVDGGSFVSLGGADLGTYTLSGLSNDVEVTVSVRAVNSIGAGLASTGKLATPTYDADVPEAFAPANWSVADASSGGTVTLTISGLPADGGAPITAVEYSIDGGAFVDLGLSAPGDADITGLSNDVAVDLALRAINDIGAGPVSATQSVTPTAPELDESFTPEEPAHARMVYDTDRLNGGLTADVPISISDPALAGLALQARAIDSAGATTAWSDIGTADGSGALSGQLTGLPRSLNWYKWQVRKTASPNEGGTTAGEFGVGDVLGFFGQSPLDQSFLTNSSPRALSAAEVLTLVTGNGTDVTHHPVTASSAFNDSASYLNDMIAATSDAVCMVVDLCRSGTGRQEWADESDTDRDHRNDQLRVDHVRNAGSEISLVYETWHTFDATEISSDFLTNFRAFYTGVDASGAQVPYGTVINGKYTLNKSLFDLSGAGRGMFDQTRTKWVMATPYGNAFEDARNYLTEPDGQVGISSRIRFQMRDQMELARLDTYMDQVVAQTGPYSYNVHTAGTIHMDDTAEFGRPQILRNGLAAMYLANGVIDDDYSATRDGTPEITGVTWAATHADVQVSVPAGRSLTTPALARGLGSLGTGQPHFAEVMGFEVAQTDTHDLLPTGFTAVIHDASAGIIRISPEAGSFEPGARIAYARGPAVPVFAASDRAAGTHFYMPVVTSGAGGGYDGIPLRPNVSFRATSIGGTDMVTRVLAPASGYRAQGATNLGSGVTALTLEYVGSVSYTNTDRVLFDMSGTSLDLEVQANGSIRFRVKGEGGITIVDATSATGLVHHGWTADVGEVIHLVAAIEVSGGSATTNVWLKDTSGAMVNIINETAATTATELENDRSLDFGFQGSTPLVGEIQKMASWLSATSDGDTSGLGTPYQIKEGNAAVFNSTTNLGTGPVFQISDDVTDV